MDSFAIHSFCKINFIILETQYVSLLHVFVTYQLITLWQLFSVDSDSPVTEYTKRLLHPFNMAAFLASVQLEFAQITRLVVGAAPHLEFPFNRFFFYLSFSLYHMLIDRLALDLQHSLQKTRIKMIQDGPDFEDSIVSYIFPTLPYTVVVEMQIRTHFFTSFYWHCIFKVGHAKISIT